MAHKSTLRTRRQNIDGSYDSICMKCFATISGTQSKIEAEDERNTHVCDSAFLAERGYFTRPESLSILP